MIVTQQGKGSFVAQVDDLGLRLREEELEQYLSQAIGIARSLGLGSEELKNRLDELLGKENSK